MPWYSSYATTSVVKRGPSASSSRSFSIAAGMFRRMSTRNAESRHCNALPRRSQGFLERLIRPLPRGFHLPKLLVRDVRPSPRELQETPPPFPKPPDHVAEALPLPLLLREQVVDVVCDRDVLRHSILRMHTHMHILFGSDVLLNLQEDGQDRQDRRVHVGAVARGARVLPRLRDDAVERFPVLLPQRASIVRPVVQDRLEVEAVRRDRAAHGVLMAWVP